ncbi:MAG: low molecular weight protein-tyrosine-phosphatase [Moheibacter sp.]
MKILMVCLGNICRSPLAEGILQSKLGEDFLVASAGTGSWHVGRCPDKRSIAVAKKYGIDISTQRARQFKTGDFDEFDLIYVMDQSNYEDVLSLAEDDVQRSKVRLILEEYENGEEKNVPDPYFGGDDGFEEVYRLLDEVTTDITSKIFKR